MTTNRNPVLLLGDVNAEADDLLSTAFYASPDYKTLLAYPGGRLVVGRRGTGKSALAWKLGQDWDGDPKMFVVRVIPTEDGVIGLRALSLRLLDYSRTRAFFRIAWKATLAHEALRGLVDNYRFKSHADHLHAAEMTAAWLSS